MRRTSFVLFLGLQSSEVHCCPRVELVFVMRKIIVLAKMSYVGKRSIGPRGVCTCDECIPDMFRVSFDLHVGSDWSRRFMLVVCLPKNLLDALGKTLALLWQVFLMAGPDFGSVRSSSWLV